MSNGNGAVVLSHEKAGEIMEAVIARGDLAQLNPQERAKYYARVCESVGLNPLTQPFAYITLNGKLTLYARKDCTDQLRAIHKVSVTDLVESEREGVFVVTAKVQNNEGRTDAAKGAVTIKGLNGDALANAMMKAETKAKRRATLSICGLGFLDETEIETIPEAAKSEPTRLTALPKKDAKPTYTKLQAEVDGFTTRANLKAWEDHPATKERISILPEDWRDILELRIREKTLDLQQQEQVNTAPQQAQATGIDTTIPANLRRTGEEDKQRRGSQPPKSKAAHADAINEAEFIRELDGALSGAESGVELGEIKNNMLLPMKGKVAAETWDKAAAMYRDRLAAVTGMTTLAAG